MREVVARPGELIVEQGDCIITSYALGSSLGICLYDATHKIGGYVNSILPKNPNKIPDAKYVNDAIKLLYDTMQHHAILEQELSAKIIGGARLFQLPQDVCMQEVGRLNIQAAYAMLTHLQIPIIKEDVGDMYGRTLHFHTESGIVYIETGSRYVYHI